MVAMLRELTREQIALAHAHLDKSVAAALTVFCTDACAATFHKLASPDNVLHSCGACRERRQQRARRRAGAHVAAPGDGGRQCCHRCRRARVRDGG